MCSVPDPESPAALPESLKPTDAVVAVSSLLQPVEVLSALADPTRWAVLRELSPGTALPLTELADRLNRHPDIISRHLRIMLDAGVVTVRHDNNDGRKRLYTIPEPCRRATEAGHRMVDYGSCLLRFS